LKILILSDDYLPASTRNHAKMLHQLGMEFVKRGYDVSVLTPSNSSIKEKLQIKIIDNISVFYFKSPNFRDTGRIIRTIRETLLPIRALLYTRKKVLIHEFDIVINFSPTIFFGMFVYFATKKHTLNYLILRDFFPQWMIDQNILHKWSPITLFFKLFSNLNYKSADIIGVQSVANLNPLKKMVLPTKKREVLHNWASPIQPETDNNFSKFLFEKLGIAKKFIIFYGGNIGVAQDMNNVLRLATMMKKFEEVHFLLVGQGEEFHRVLDAKKTIGLNNVTVHPSVNQIDYESILLNVSVGLFSLSRQHTTHNIPGKLLGYLSAGLPVLGSVNPNNDVIELVNSYKAGFVVENGDDNSFFDNACLLYNDTKLRNDCQLNSSRLLREKFSVSATANQIIKAKLVQ
jgi:glycosyltransferase involved in cell wall biosynthesis